MRAAVCSAILLLACGDSRTPADASTDTMVRDTISADSADVGDAVGDAGERCFCEPGPHQDFIYLISDEGEIWTYDPRTDAFEFVVGPVCLGTQPFSMAVDTAGRAWINDLGSMGVLVLDLLDPGPCVESPYVRTNPDFGLFGMSFASNSATDFCSDLYVMTYSGDGGFDEGPGLGRLGVIDRETGDITDLASTDFDGGELTGTGDGRLFGFAGDLPVKLVEYDRETGALLDTIPLSGVRKTNASAAAFFGGDIYIFIEALPAGCLECLETECGAAVDECRRDETCSEHLDCVLTTPVFSDACGGGLSDDMMACVPRCESCIAPSRARVSRVIRYDLDRSAGGGFTDIIEAPVRIVGAASSPCVPVELI